VIIWPGGQWGSVWRFGWSSTGEGAATRPQPMSEAPAGCRRATVTRLWFRADSTISNCVAGGRQLMAAWRVGCSTRPMVIWPFDDDLCICNVATDPRDTAPGHSLFAPLGSIVCDMTLRPRFRSPFEAPTGVCLLTINEGGLLTLMSLCINFCFECLSETIFRATRGSQPPRTTPTCIKQAGQGLHDSRMFVASGLRAFKSQRLSNTEVSPSYKHERANLT
jgi:hypothetical protein